MGQSNPLNITKSSRKNSLQNNSLNWVSIINFFGRTHCNELRRGPAIGTIIGKTKELS
jgi:hypothetical protein